MKMFLSTVNGHLVKCLMMYLHPYIKYAAFVQTTRKVTGLIGQDTRA